ncbi:PP2C family serine/threonine-protein phosphatase [Nocardiopsis sp. MG754419]|uniref:PP2C family protein-serine/threonine phosphatase n=1 Tax=Nocardiopsis sp. MG754419 TaxID=2259865 RepID=UPI001BAE08BE|nr:protein phosphatase 2C domain-containing protein [Nocardiopsis sp. MG754419]MBR8744350.1 serine/threonine protein phosphatase [Nocardiopsis sp. MG754419]
MTMVRTCPACADTVAMGDAFCEGCGRNLPEAARAPTPPAEAMTPDAVPTAPQESLSGVRPDGPWTTAHAPADRPGDVGRASEGSGASEWDDTDAQVTQPLRRDAVIPEIVSLPESPGIVPEWPPPVGGTSVAVDDPGLCVWCPGRVSDGYCEECGFLQPTGRDHVEVRAGRAFGVSDRGLRHRRNEDAMAIRVLGDDAPHAAGAVVAVVCDGVSSSPRSDEASRVTAETGATVLAERLRQGVGAREATGAAMTRAARAVAAIADGPDSAPACTFVCAVTDPRTGSVTVGWVGDSRAYWLSGGPGSSTSTLLTRDDSWSEAMVQMGALSREEAMRSANAHALIAWMGADSGEIDAHISTVTPTGPGTVLLCSDGLWNYYAEAEALADAVPEVGAAPLEAARAYVDLALKAGGRDNITVVVLPVPPGGHRVAHA